MYDTDTAAVPWYDVSIEWALLQMGVCVVRLAVHGMLHIAGCAMHYLYGMPHPALANL